MESGLVSHLRLKVQLLKFLRREGTNKRTRALMTDELLLHIEMAPQSLEDGNLIQFLRDFGLY